MNLCLLITLPFIFLLFKATEAKINNKWRITLYIGKTNWNTGVEYCVNTGGRMIRLDKVRTDVLAEYKQGIWNAHWEKEFLMGLHIIDGEYKWQGYNCSETADISSWSNWKTNDPTRVCATAESDDYQWKSKDCDHKHRLICEYNLGACTFDGITDTDGTSSCTYSMNPNPSVNMSVDECKESCQTWTYNGKDCWAVTFDPVSMKCYGSFGINPFLFQESTSCSTVNLTGTIMYHRNCFEGTIGGSVPDLKYDAIIEVVESVLCAVSNLTDTTAINQPTTDSLLTTELTTSTADTTTDAADTTTDAADTTTDEADTTTDAADTTTDEADTTTDEADTTTDEADTTTDAADTTTVAADTTTDAADTTTDEADTTTDAADTTTDAADTTTDAADTTTVAADTTTDAADTTTVAADTTTSMADTTTIDVPDTSTLFMTTNVSGSGCFCLCKNSTMTLEEKLEYLNTLKINKETTTKAKLKLQCAVDERASAKYVGMIGVAMLCIVCGLMLFSDCIAFLSYMDKRKQTNPKNM